MKYFASITATAFLFAVSFAPVAGAQWVKGLSTSKPLVQKQWVKAFKVGPGTSRAS